ncbi:MAG: hypothetical protein RLZZ401_1832 [Pseudomonadota bacterium]
MHPSQMDNAQPNLCKAHCESGQQAHESKSSADVQLPALEGVWLLVSVLPFETVLTSQAAPLTYLSARPPGSPPLYLAHQVFRL